MIFPSVVKLGHIHTIDLKYERLKWFQIKRRSAYLPAVKSVTGSVFMVIAIITSCLLLWTVWYLQTGADYISASAGYGRLQVRTNLTQAGFTYIGSEKRLTMDLIQQRILFLKSIVNSRSESTLERYMFRNKPKSLLDERWGSIRQNSNNLINRWEPPFIKLFILFISYGGYVLY